jgi:PAS domain S-box-containing protein
VTIRPRILIVEDSPDDAELEARVLRQSGFDLTYERVDTPEAMQAALEAGSWDLVTADFSMPRFSGLAALKLLQDKGFDLPFILVSGTVGEDVAVQAMRAGAQDYVLKTNLARLPLAIERELREAETRREAKRAEARYRTLFDRVPVGITSTTPEGKLLAANPAFVEMLGFADVEALKRANIEEFWVNPEDRERMIALLARDGIIQHFELQLRRKDGTVICCAVSTRAVYDATGKMESYEGVTVDITDRKRQEEEITRARDLAIEAARLRSEFMHNVSHEIRTPLNGIIGTAEILLLEDDLTPKQRHGMEIIQSSSELLLTIVNDILDFSKLSAGKVALEKLDFSLVELVEAIIDSFAEAARAKKIDLAMSLDAKLPAGLRGDPNRLRQILNNLISNAIKFISVGGVLVRATKAEESDDQVLVRFEVIDTGIGIPLEVQDRLFQPFAQVEGSTSRHYGGTGLGLVISAQLTKQMGGEIGFESTPGKGSNFHFTLRLEKATGIASPWVTTASGDSRFKGMRVLIADESSINRRVISEYLTSWGIANLAVSNSAVLLNEVKRAQKMEQTVVLLDEQFPGMSGSSLARAIKHDSLRKETKIVILSSEGGAGTENAGSIIAKPVRPSRLYSCLLALALKTDEDSPNSSERVPHLKVDKLRHEWREGVRVLVIEDNVTNRTVIGAQLGMLGYTAEVVEDARRGLEALSVRQHNIVLMDCEMPEMDGYEATAEIRRREGNARHTVVIALTAHATEGDRERCLEAGMDDYVSKPVKLEALTEMLDSWSRRMVNHGREGQTPPLAKDS